ncbi:MAG: paraquat-inducible protein A [Bacteroidota bacterium]
MTARNDKSHTWPGFIKPLLIAGLIIVLLIEAWCGYQVHELTEKRKEYKTDYAFVNNVSFGLLSVDRWRDQVVASAGDKIEDFRLTPEQEAGLRKEINNGLHGLVDEAFQSINKKQTSIGGKLKKFAVKTLVDPKQVHSEVPGFTNKLMAEITKPASYKRIANIADTALAQLGRKIYDSSMASTTGIMDSIYKKYEATDKAGFEKTNAIRANNVKEGAWKYTYWMLGAALLIPFVWFLFRRKTYLEASLCVLSIAAAIMLLVIGVTTTMIEVDARIEKLELPLLGKAISFENQDLFFQSQSIMDVIKLLIQSGRVDSLIVGLMVLIFAVLFPLVKLVAIAMSAISPNKWAKREYVDYFAFGASKWDMSNVMVVAILMTYIGFNGIVDSTLSSLNVNDGSMTSITTNNTTIQPGYIIFIVFVGTVLAISSILHNRIKLVNLDERKPYAPE